MPISKRRKEINLGKVSKQNKEGKKELIETIQSYVTNYNYIWRLEPEGMRNLFLQQIRADWAHKGKIIFCKRTLMQKAIGVDKMESVEDYFESFIKKDHARSGNIASGTIIIPEGIVRYNFGSASNDYSNGGFPIPVTMSKQLEKLGMPVVVEREHLVLKSDYKVCNIGDKLSIEQAHLLKLLQITISEFKLKLTHYYDKSTKEVKVL
ncbi:11327_t:CDS:2 [Entrophospora sp. SA101]|nr:3126_t:CDS:2 [Entrophospora sp. SA101]CAJ0752016.1 18081_t:CDS:2 [Entrophospora sp. SA101]CAJ0754948.1 21191_t:CDS:2 [Entrophospora sp. SA101]CAJ0763793.1 11327_t:CDS:2 [Entrophospora sp. SA101]CAJ0871963.1 11002_t:CDS:2 [Entrophospora sp. SA101]